jgi:pimeloyl-ACP methyl ester carboxylesterase
VLPVTRSVVVRSGRAHLAVEHAGEGPPIVFLHSGVGDRRMWRHSLTAASAAHHAVAYDRRGFGESAPVEESFSQVEDLLAVLDELAGATTRAVLVGCSQGGRIALDAALTHPERVCALVLVAPAVSGVPPPPALPADQHEIVEDLERAEAAGDLERVNALEARMWLDGPFAPEARVTGAPRDLFLDMNGVALRALRLGTERPPPSAYDRVHEIRAPTLVVAGDLDFLPIQELCRHLAATIPGARLEVMTGVAHLPSLERPAELWALIGGFLASAT